MRIWIIVIIDISSSFLIHILLLSLSISLLYLLLFQFFRVSTCTPWPSSLSPPCSPSAPRLVGLWRWVWAGRSPQRTPPASDGSHGGSRSLCAWLHGGWHRCTAAPSHSPQAAHTACAETAAQDQGRMGKKRNYL